MISPRQKRLIFITITFIISFATKLIYLLHPFTIKMVSDNSGCLLGSAYLAGLDWRQAAVANYYGQGWYIIYSFLFRMTDDAYLIYTAMIVFNTVFISATSILIYFIMVKFLGCRDGLFATLASALCVHFIDDPGNGTRTSNEPPVFIFTWVICFFLLYTYYNKGDRKKSICGMIGLVAVQSYALLVHTRMVVIILAIIICAVLFWIYYREWIINPLHYLPATFAAIGLALVIKNHIVSILWQSDNPEGIHNYNLGVERVFKVNYTVKSIFDVFFSNIYKLALSTDGILCIGIIFFTALLVKIGIKLLKKYPVEKGCRTEKALFIMFVTFSICVTICICGIVILYSDGIALGYASNTENDRFSGLTYTRYYLSFAGPMLLAVLVTANNNRSLITKYYKWVFPLWFMLFLYIFLSVAPELNSYLSRLSRSSYTDDGLVNVFLTFRIMLILLTVFFFLVKNNKCVLFVALMLLRIFRAGLITVEEPYFQVSSSIAGATYTLIRNIESTIELPQNIYTYSIRKDETQLLLNRYTIIPLDDAESVKEQDALLVVTGILSEQDQISFLEAGYVGIVLDNNEMIWSNSTELVECIRGQFGE